MVCEQREVTAKGKLTCTNDPCSNEYMSQESARPHPTFCPPCRRRALAKEAIESIDPVREQAEELVASGNKIGMLFGLMVFEEKSFECCVLTRASVLSLALEYPMIKVQLQTPPREGRFPVFVRRGVDMVMLSVPLKQPKN